MKNRIKPPYINKAKECVNGHQDAGQVINKDEKAAVEQIFPGKFIKETDHWAHVKSYLVCKDEGARERVVCKMGSAEGVTMRVSLIELPDIEKPVLVLEEV